MLLNLLEMLQIVHRLVDNTLIVPALLPDYLAGHQAIWPAHDPEKLQFKRIYEFSFFPPGLFSRVLVFRL